MSDIGLAYCITGALFAAALLWDGRSGRLSFGEIIGVFLIGATIWPAGMVMAALAEFRDLRA